MIETPAYAAMLSRMLRAYTKRVGADDPVDLARMVEFVGEADQALTDAVSLMRERGLSWSEIGAGLGMSRQGAEQWHSRRTRARDVTSMSA